MYILSIVVGLYVFLLIIAIFFSNSIIFPAPAPSYKLSSGYEKIILDDGSVIVARELKSDNSDIWILFNHGNGVDLGLIEVFLERIREKLGCSVIAYDYPGYGASPGSPSESSVNSAAEAVYSHLRAKGVPENKIIVWGRSIGGGPATEVARNHPVSKLILESAFISAFRVVTKVKIMPLDKFDNLAKIDKVECPTFFIHGKLDRVIPFFHGKTLYDKAKTPKTYYWLDAAGHNNVEYTDETEYWKRIKEFILNRK